MRLMVLGMLVACTVACGGGGNVSLSPTSPSAVTGGQTATGAVIAGRVNSQAASPVGVAGADRWSTAGLSTLASGITVTIVGTNVSTTVDGTGQFVLSDVPTGSVQLKFAGNGVDATLTISGINAADRIEISVTLSGSNARVDADRRSNNGVEVNGLITSINANARTFLVGSESVSVPAGTTIRHGSTSLQFSDLKVGDKVQVKGTRANGVVTATEVKREEVGGVATPTPTPTTSVAEVTGAISGLSGACPSLSFSIGTTRVTTSNATSFRDGSCTQLKNGTIVEAKGPRGANGVVAATDVENKSDDEDDDDEDDDRGGSSNGDVRAEGAVSALGGTCPSITFTVAGTSVRTDTKTDFRDACSAIKNTSKVKVRGTKAATGTVLATRVELD